MKLSGRVQLTLRTAIAYKPQGHTLTRSRLHTLRNLTPTTRRPPFSKPSRFSYSTAMDSTTTTTTTTPQPPKTESNTQPESSRPALPALPAAGNASQTLEVGGAALRLDHLGPLVVNEDGTMSRISNWDKMMDIEKENTLRILGKRNEMRLAKLRAAKAESGKSENEPEKAE
ncbi:hypothetical protein HD806DRAFT_226671 [Xylariaceae sp. AK1471]|nr:hypothetical protein HD806DRAFT_226671 [Xylariaceae sp. AK1471]